MRSQSARKLIRAKMYTTSKVRYIGDVFRLQVSTAVRLCDGALVVVDVVEGVCPQVNTKRT